MQYYKELYILLTLKKVWALSDKRCNRSEDDGVWLNNPYHQDTLDLH